MKIYAIRGATTVSANDEAAVKKNTAALIGALMSANGLDKSDAVSLIISSTADITAFYPARAVRESGLLDCALFSVLEPPITDSVPLCIRALLTVQPGRDLVPRHVYLEGAKVLRPDIDHNR
ncbi:MAG: chorismate mutase [Clostridiales bacterium]|jgi:chorismate mutase|nr:chorismate mutase [Clostridiales bacterium]